jgi:biotin carboxyl carrier protein
MKWQVRLNGAHGEKKHLVELEPTAKGYRVTLDGEHIDGDAVMVVPGTVSVIIGGESFQVHVSRGPDDQIKLQSEAHEFTAEIQDPRAWQGRRHGGLEAEGRQQIVAPMPGKVIRLLVNSGDEVEAGQGLVVMEAMKMQNEIRSPKKGKVERLQVKEGQAVNAGDVLAWVD